ncbi:DUF1566 domain-containing protein [Pseudomonas aeruginosa]|nr:DUF1566 domain-containing protein [Pseudomonas aeruginosa]EKU4547776.1 DUF1566 domain-containing protein [Pseudomonas aeruginosa]EKV6736681.1 DUF1566 domain-containing protein [Pseudomonas aeruginosa]EKV6880014.1 DUF1566 domain-containing protein [Pseudomonas aeruginosa]EKX0392466.1 DUF1566 domain-containing protein [Pseudomonas aeruginosa]
MISEETGDASLAQVDGIPAIGAEWPGQGGIYAGLMRGHDGHPDYHLIVASAESDGEFQWGGYGSKSSATSKWDGLANTKALVEEGGHPAAEFAASVTISGHNDFYLPAQAELMLAWANVPEVFVEGWHWSSTQYAANYAFSTFFNDGYPDSYGKNGDLRVRPVRKILILQ